MIETRYKLMFNGEPLPGVALETVKENLARLFKSETDKIDSLFEGHSVALKRGLSEAEADKYLAALEQAGAKVRKVQDLEAGLSLVATEEHTQPAPSDAAQAGAASQSISCPKCGHEQPKAIECQACGIIIDKYLARQAQRAAEPAQVKESVASPYAPPQAQVGEQLTEYGELKVLSLDGRLGRVRYLSWHMAMLLLLLPLGLLIFDLSSLSNAISGLLLAIIGLVVGFISICISVKRLHDIGWSGWLLLLVAVPVIGGLFQLLLYFIPGTNGPNRYGPPPPPNSRAVKVLAWLASILILVCIVAAIIIPTYQDYLLRAKYVAPLDPSAAVPQNAPSE